MKKKGRVCGTIGMILSLALAGGTVVYGTMFHGNAVGLAEKPLGASTGSTVVGILNGMGVVKNWEGVNNTRTLIGDSAAALTQKAAEGQKYISYSLSFTMTLDVNTDGEDGAVSIAKTEGRVYADDSYTYIRLGSFAAADGETKTASFEYCLNKESGNGYMRESAYAALNPSDAAMLDGANWVAEGEDDDGTEAVGTVIASVDSYFDMLDGENAPAVKIGPTGELTFSPAEKATCRFTVGFCPSVGYTLESDVGTVSVILTYENINNTKINLSDSAKEVIK